jgi:hypothetical protein
MPRFRYKRLLGGATRSRGARRCATARRRRGAWAQSAGAATAGHETSLAGRHELGLAQLAIAICVSAGEIGD